MTSTVSTAAASITASIASMLPEGTSFPIPQDLPELIATLQSNKLVLVFVAPAVTTFFWFAGSYFTNPLKKFEGPLLAGWTNLFRMRLAISADYAPRMKKLHEKYGPVVRLGPNLLDLDYPELSRTIYNTDGKWNKTDFYKNSSSYVEGVLTYHMFSTVESVKHARMKRPVVRHYSVPAVLAMEPHMDAVIADFTRHMDTRFAKTGKVCDFSDWLAYFNLKTDAWDFLGAVTFSEKFGYMKAGCDFDGTLAVADQSIDYLGMCGQMPWLDWVLDKNPVYPLGPPNISNVTGIAVNNLISRLKGEDKNFDPEKPDFLHYFIESMSTHPDVVNEGAVVGYLLLNLIAGADTTTITMHALFYHCLKQPEIYRKLVAEVRENVHTREPCPHSVARSLPFLDAVIKETLRYHPAVSMCLERIVPEGGLVLPDGRTVPAGTFVGMNPYILGRNKKAFGEDADTFRPDRWLQGDDETEEAFKARMQDWGNANLTFGGGSRICLGRNLSMMEVYKVVPTLISNFDIELHDPKKSWWTSSRWFYRTKEVICNIKPRAD